MDPKDIKKEYTNGEVAIVWESAKCIHSVYVLKIIQMFFIQNRNLGYYPKTPLLKKLWIPSTNVLREL